MVLAQKVGAAVFDSLSAEGTNLLIRMAWVRQKVPILLLKLFPPGWRWINVRQTFTEDEIDFVYILLKEEGEK